MAAFSIKVRVFYEDTDAGGIVYHANYLKFCERARTEWLRSCGVSQGTLLAAGSGFVVGRLEAAFKRSARLDDLLTITCVPIKLKRVMVTFLQEVRNESGELLFTMTADVAYVDKNQGGLSPIPKEMASLITGYIEDHKEI